MPRHTHPQPVRKHSRAHQREQRDRFIHRNWQRAKSRYSRHLDAELLHPETARHDPSHPHAWWPFTLAPNELTRNPFNHCSCWMCSYRPEDRRQQRHRERADWREEAREQVEATDPDEHLNARVRHQRTYPPADSW